MSFYKEILPFMDYIHSVRKLESYLSFDMKFPMKWSLPKSVMDECQIIPYEVGVENFKGLSFVSKMDEPDINFTLSKVLKIINLNKERELKERLFKDTVDKLKTTFEKTDLDKLQKLYFDFESEYSETLLGNGTDRQETADTELVSE
jgi:hypothetical protein